jgi:sulfatase maturation enzyme AslB (radical SAM superfamily)
MFSRFDKISLPIYQAQMNDLVLFYAPGCLVGIDLNWVTHFEQLLIEQKKQNTGNPDPQFYEVVRELIQASSGAVEAWQTKHQATFRPHCLTLYPQNDCNLACSYCFSTSFRDIKQKQLSLPAVSAAARMVSENCQTDHQPLTVVLHGGGEPSLDIQWVKQALKLMEGIAESAQVPIFRYIATNGVMSEEKAEWLAQHFDLIGLSCDGPDSIQQVQRPLRNGQNSSLHVKRMAEIMHKAGKPLHIRVTITPQSMPVQAEIAAYICEQLYPQEIHVEPVYAGSDSQAYFKPEEAGPFVKAFLEAREIAMGYGIPWQTSGSRPGEIHGPYCQVLRDVLQLIPGDRVVSCFKTCNAEQAFQNNTLIGVFDPVNETIRLDFEQVQQTQAAVLDHWLFDDRCKGVDCFNFYHCVRTCPDDCALDPTASMNRFRCWLNQEFTASKISGITQINANRKPVWLAKL